MGVGGCLQPKWGLRAGGLALLWSCMRVLIFDPWVCACCGTHSWHDAVLMMVTNCLSAGPQALGQPPAPTHPTHPSKAITAHPVTASEQPLVSPAGRLPAVQAQPSWR